MSDYTTDGQRVSYGLGHQMGQQMMENPFDGLEVATVMAVSYTHLRAHET